MTSYKIENELPSDFFPAPLNKSRVWLKKDHKKTMRILAVMAHNTVAHRKNRHMNIIMCTTRAEEQYALLMFYYKCAGVIQKSPTSHEYNPLKHWEEDEIMRLYMQGIPKLHIANRLNRHISTVFYFIRRATVAAGVSMGSIPTGSIAHAQIEHGQGEQI